MLIGLAAYLILSPHRQRYTPNPAFPQFQPEPQPGTPQWAMWANGIIQITGGLTTALFGPGGPFEGKTIQEVLQGSQGQYEGPGQAGCIDPITWQSIPC